jgi:TonB family protein
VKKLILALALIAAPSAAAAQTSNAGKVITIAPGAEVVAFARGGQRLAAFPVWWHDSIVTAIATWVRPQATALEQTLPPGAYGELSLQLRRNGDLYRVRIVDSVGVGAVDSALIAGVWLADEALAFPAFPPQVDGAGTEVRIRLMTPFSSPRAGRAFADPVYEVPQLGAACDSLLAAPNAVHQSFAWLRIDSTTGGDRGPVWARTFVGTLTETVPELGAIRPPQRPSAFLERFTAAYRTSGWYHIEVNATGRVESATINSSSGFPTLDSAILTAIHRADSQGMIPPPPTMNGAPTAVDLGLEFGPGTPENGIRLAPIGIGYWALQAPPRVKGIGRAPRYPPNLRASGIGGRVVIEFVVGSDGVPVSGSMRLISTPHAELVVPSLQVIASTTFHPGTIGGCAIPVVVRQAVNYNASGPRPLRARDVQTTRPIN